MNELKQLIRSRKGFVFDLDGTLYLGEGLLPGADRVVARLREAGKRIAFVTNKAIESREHCAAKLRRLGIPCNDEDVINSSLVLARYLQRTRPGARVYAIAEAPVLRDLTAHGLVLCDDPEQIDVVAVSWDRHFDYDKLNTAYLAARQGADLVATNPDRTCPMQGYRLPDCACMIAAIEACTQRVVEPIVGKPSEIMLREVMGVLGLGPEECVMVGDRHDTDMTMAARAGLAGIMVLTGIGTREDAASMEHPPTAVISGVAELAELI